MILLCHCKYTTTACVWWPCDQCTVGNMPDQHRSVLAWAAIYQKTKIQFCHFVWSMHLSLLQLIWLFKSVKHGKTSLKAYSHCKSPAASFLLTSLHHLPTLYHCHLPDHYQCYQMDQFKVFYQIEWIFLLLYMFYLVISWALPAWNAIN